jgi:PKD repeat protein
VANGPYAGSEGEWIQFTSAGSTDPNGDALRYSWSFGDGSRSTDANPRKRYGDDGTYTVTLTLTDPDGGRSSVATTATIANLPPTGTFSVSPTTGGGTAAGEGGTYPVRKLPEGTAYSLTLKGTDPGTHDRAALQYSLDCGRGAGYTPWSSGKTLACPAFPDQAQTYVRARVRDDDGASTTYVVDLRVTNAAPSVTLTPTSATTVRAGASVAFLGAFTDRGAGDGPWSYTVNWGDGAGATTGTATQPGAPIALSHTFAKAGTFRVQMNVRDADGAAGKSARVTVTVTP